MLKYSLSAILAVLITVTLNAQDGGLSESKPQDVDKRPSLDELMAGFRRLEDFHRGLKVVERITLSREAEGSNASQGMSTGEGDGVVVTTEAVVYDGEIPRIIATEQGGEEIVPSSINSKMMDDWPAKALSLSGFAVFPLENNGLMVYGDRRLSRYFDATPEVFSLRWSGKNAIVQFTANDGRTRFTLELQSDADGLWGPIRLHRVIRSAGQVHEDDWRLENFTSNIRWTDPQFHGKGSLMYRIQIQDKDLVKSVFKFEVVSRELSMDGDVWRNYSIVPPDPRPNFVLGHSPNQVPSLPLKDALSPDALSAMTLEEVMRHFEEVEWSYLPFHVESHETRQVDGRPLVEKNAPRQAFEGFATVQYAGRVDGNWRLMKEYRHTFRSKTNDFSRELLKPGEATASIGMPKAFFPIIPLAGVFPLAGLQLRSNEIPLLSDFARKYPDKVTLGWENRVARLTVKTRSYEFDCEISIWLRPDLKWHPVRMQRTLLRDDGVPEFEWSLSEIDVSGEFPRVSSGKVKQLWELGKSEESSGFSYTDFRIKGSRFRGAVRENVFAEATPIGGSPLPNDSLTNVIYDIASDVVVSPVERRPSAPSTPDELRKLRVSEIEREIATLQLDPDVNNGKISELQKELVRLKQIQEQTQHPLTFFHLSRTKATDLCLLLIERYPQEARSFSIDEKLNAVLARVGEPLRSEIGELVNKLEGPERTDWPSSTQARKGERSQTPVDPTHIKLFSLNRPEFQNTTRILNELFSHTGQIMSTDDTRCQIIVRGTAEQLDEVEKMIRELRLKKPERPPLPTVAANLPELRQQLRDAEQRARETARKIRTMQSDPETASSETKQRGEQLLQELKQQVVGIRVLDERIKRIELQHFEERLKDLRELTETRNKLTQHFIEKKVADLLQSVDSEKDSETRKVGSTEPLDRRPIEAHDVLHVEISWGLAIEHFREVTVRVSADGSIRLPVIGPIPVGGLTLCDCEKMIVETAEKKGVFENLAVFISPDEDYRAQTR